MKKERSCGCIIIKNKAVLLVTHNDGHVSFPKGHIEIGETEEETALRETAEETGLICKIISTKKYTETYMCKVDTEKEVTFFLAEPISGTLTPQESEIKSIAYVPFEQALKTLTYEETKLILTRVLQEQSN